MRIAYRATGVVAATIGVLAGFGCSDPELNTDLRPDGPPEVLAVLVMTDALTQLSERATHCKVGDDKRPGVVGLPDFTTQQVCPEDLSANVMPVETAYPDGWYVRIMFDELLDPDIEELSEIFDADGNSTGTFSGSIRAANPVTLQCRSVVDDTFKDVGYDGYYSPSGNRVTWPVGPSLVIKPNDPTLIATGKECQITLNDSIRDKENRPVPTTQRGPFTFRIAPITAIVTDPVDSLEDDEPTEVDAHSLFFSNFYWQFNTEVSLSGFCTDNDFPGTFEQQFADADAGAGLCDQGTEAFQLAPPVVASDAGGGWGVCNISGDPCSTLADCGASDTSCDTSYAYTYSTLDADDEIGIGFATPLKTDTQYTFSLKAGTKLRDRCGVETTMPAPTPDNMLAIRLKTNPFALSSTSIVTGETVPMTRKLQLAFTNVVDPGTLEPEEYTISPEPEGFAIGQFGLSRGEIIFGGRYAPNTPYTFTLEAGATFADYHGATYTTAEAQTITWKTQPRVTLTASSPAPSDVIQKIRRQQLVGVTLTFNADMDVTTLTTDDITFESTTTGGSVTALGTFQIGTGSGAASANCSNTSNTCQLRIRGDLPPDTYKFTLKQGAQISDKLGNVYTQEKDLAITFTVRVPAPTAQCL